MTQITIESFRLNQSGKSGTIKAADGRGYFYAPWQEKFLTAGATIDAPITESEWQGKPTYWLAKTWPPQNAQNAARSQPAAQAAPPPPAQHAPVPQTNGNSYTAKDVLITSTALMKSFIETGKFGLTDLDVLMKACVPAARLMVKAAAGTPSNGADHGGTFTGGDQ